LYVVFLITFCILFFVISHLSQTPVILLLILLYFFLLYMLLKLKVWEVNWTDCLVIFSSICLVMSQPWTLLPYWLDWRESDSTIICVLQNESWIIWPIFNVKCIYLLKCIHVNFRSTQTYIYDLKANTHWLKATKLSF